MMIELCRRYGPFRSARVIPNGVALSAFAPAPKQPQLLAAGRLWDEAKNIAALQPCAAALAWPVYIAGAARTPDGARCDYTPCRWLGALSRPELSRALAQSEIYALPARYEPFGLSVLEAAASGCALVLGRIPSLLENWYGAACFVDPEDPAQLTRTLQQLIAAPERRADLQARARERARSFSAARMARAYYELYAELKCAPSARGELRCAS
jgi:glycosyltransferase involved in cell wall biosynthesis